MADERYAIYRADDQLEGGATFCLEVPPELVKALQGLTPEQMQEAADAVTCLGDRREGETLTIHWTRCYTKPYSAYIGGSGADGLIRHWAMVQYTGEHELDVGGPFMPLDEATVRNLQRLGGRLTDGEAAWIELLRKADTPLPKFDPQAGEVTT